MGAETDGRGIAMDIRILELIDGARQAEGLTVIIDVFRAFSLECYLFAAGAERIFPVGRMEDAFAIKEAHPDYVLIGERGGAQVSGCDFGNSPIRIRGIDFTGKTVIHSTSAGTQGIVNAAHADEIITGSLVNVPAVAEYIRRRNPAVVSLVAMGNAGVRTAKEDVLCAQYIRALLEENQVFAAQVQARADALRFDGGEHFFRPDTQSVFPQEDFFLCTRCGSFDFVIRVDKAGEAYVNTCVRIESEPQQHFSVL